MFKADLHIHSHYSDGVWSIEQILQQAQSLGLNALSITDHDTLASYPEALTLGKTHGCKVLPGIELSSHNEQTTVHVLGFSFKLDDSKLQHMTQQLKQARLERIHQIFERLEKRGLNLDIQDFFTRYPSLMLGRAHIADYLTQMKITSSMTKAFEFYLSDQQVGSLKLRALTTVEAIELIHQAGGFAVLAHPHQIKHKNKLRKVLKLPFDGIEVFYANFSKAQNEKFLEFANQKNQITTGGSDFHRPQPYLSLASSWTPESSFNKLYERHLLNNPNLS